MTLAPSPDQVNAIFEFGGSIAVANHCRQLLRDKTVAGVSKLSVLFFLSWGFWNLWYYPSLEQMWSFTAGAVLALTNVIWLALMWKYRTNSKNPAPTSTPKDL